MKSREILKWTLFIAMGLSLFIGLLELSLRVMGTYNSHNEQTGGSFFSAYETFSRKNQWTWPENSETQLEFEEFKYSFVTNSLGVRDREHPLIKPDSVYRILMMGDSYMESFGSANEDSTILHMMEEKLNQNPDEVGRYEVMSGASAGSDLFFCYLFFKKRLIAYRPDLVVLNINSTDIMDYCTRGVLDRFDADGNIRFLPNPVNANLYRYCHIYRFWVHEVLRRERNTFLKPEELNACKSNFVKEARALLTQFEYLAQLQDFELRVVVYPLWGELNNNRYPEELQAILPANTIDMMDSLTKHQKHCPEMLYWPIDGHFTPHGYAVFSEALVHSLKAEILDKNKP